MRRARRSRRQQRTRARAAQRLPTRRVVVRRALLEQRSAVETLVALLQQGTPYDEAAGRKALRGAGAGALLSATAARGRSIGERAATALSLLG